MILRDSIGVPLEPEWGSHIIAYDWRDEPIYSDDSDKYFEYDGDLILDDESEVYDYFKKMIASSDYIQELI